MNRILATKFNIYGFELFEYWSSDKDWTNSPGVAFPRVTLCDFNMRRLGNVHPYTVQCTLPINMYNEKIYMFLWFWFVFVAIMSCLGFVQWVIRYLFRGDKITYLFNHLTSLQKIEHDAEETKKVDRFYGEYLRQDGVFLLRLIGHNTNNITVTDITGSLWDKWEEMVHARESRPPFYGDEEVSDPLHLTEKEKENLAEKEKLT